MNLKDFMTIRKHLVLGFAFLLSGLIGCINSQPIVKETRETWEYNKFIQEVKKGNIEKVNISADRTDAIVHVKNDPHQKKVILTNDPNFINILTQNQVDISVLPQSTR